MKRIFISILLITCFSATADNRRDIIDAIRKDDVGFLKALIPTSEDMLIEQSQDSVDILGYAVSMNAHEIFSEMIKSYPRYVVNNSPTVLSLACASNRKNRKFIEALLGLGVDINTINGSGTNCLYSAVISADLEFFNYLIGLGANPKIKVVPDEVFGYSEPVSIEVFLKNRLKKYQEMENRITMPSN